MTRMLSVCPHSPKEDGAGFHDGIWRRSEGGSWHAYCTYALAEADVKKFLIVSFHISYDRCLVVHSNSYNT